MQVRVLWPAAENQRFTFKLPGLSGEVDLEGYEGASVVLGLVLLSTLWSRLTCWSEGLVHVYRLVWR